MTTAALVLAAGGGSRYHGSTHKLLADYGGRPIAQAAIEAAVASGFDQVAVVIGAVDLRAYCPSDVAVLENPRWQEGLSSSLAVGIEWCRARHHDVAVVGLGDAPAIPASAWRAVGHTDAEVAVASFSGDKRPPVRLARSVWNELPSSGDVGARALWQRPGALEVPCEGDPIDVDTVEDLDELVHKLTP